MNTYNNNRKNKKIAALSIIFCSILGFLIYYNYTTLIPKLEEHCEGPAYFYIYGNTKKNISIPLEALLNGTYSRIENQNAFFRNAFGTEFNSTISGVLLWDILQKHDIIAENATHIYFEASDGYKSPKIPLSLLSKYPDQILLLTHEKNMILKAKEEGGDGPIKGYVSISAIENNQELRDLVEMGDDHHIYNTLFAVKWVAAIKII